MLASYWTNHIISCLRGKGPPDRIVGKTGAICFWQPTPSGLNPVVAAVLRDSLCVVSLLPCVADCFMLYTECKVERFVLTIIKRRLLLLSLLYRKYLQAHVLKLVSLISQLSTSDTLTHKQDNTWASSFLASIKSFGRWSLLSTSLGGTSVQVPRAPRFVCATSVLSAFDFPRTTHAPGFYVKHNQTEECARHSVSNLTINYNRSPVSHGIYYCHSLVDF